MSLLEYQELKSELKFIPIELSINIEQDEGQFKNISAITGIAIPLYFQWACEQGLDHSRIFIAIKNKFEANKDVIGKQYQDFITDLINHNKQFTEKKLLKLANIWASSGSNQINSQSHQINEDNYNWLNSDQLNRLAGLMIEYINENSLHEQRYSLSERPELHDKILTGYIDCIDHTYKTVWEFKCTKAFNNLNYLQLVIYAYLFETQRKLEYEKHQKMDIYDRQKVKIDDIIEFKEMNEYGVGKVNKMFPLGFEVEINKTEIRSVKYEFFVKKLNYDNELLQSEEQLTSKYNFLLFNIIKNEIHQVTCKYENLKKIVDLLVKSKYYKSQKKTKTEFIKENNLIRSKHDKFSINK